MEKGQVGGVPALIHGLQNFWQFSRPLTIFIEPLRNHPAPDDTGFGPQMSRKMEQEGFSPHFTVSLRCETFIGFSDPQNYINIFHADLNAENVKTGEQEVIGQARVYQLLFGRANNDGFPHMEIWDFESPLIEIGMQVYDFECDELSEEVLQKIGGESWAADLLVIDRVTVLPAWRGKSVGALFLRELIARLRGNALYALLKAFPLQHELRIRNGGADEFEKRLELDRFPSDEFSARAKLGAYYEELGFRYCGNGIYMMNLEIVNPLDRIRLENLV